MSASNEQIRLLVYSKLSVSTAVSVGKKWSNFLDALVNAKKITASEIFIVDF